MKHQLACGVLRPVRKDLDGHYLCHLGVYNDITVAERVANKLWHKYLEDYIANSQSNSVSLLHL